jgi:hypothetical protein
MTYDAMSQEEHRLVVLPENVIHTLFDASTDIEN